MNPKDVFINCPFDKDYWPFLRATVFVIYATGFRPRCALEEDDSGVVRMEKLLSIIEQCKLAMHDISRTELDTTHRLPRFNMPFELGLFLGARRLTTTETKPCIIFERAQYSYQKYISDIAGQDIRAHEDIVEKLMQHLRNWLNSQSRSIFSNTKPLPSARFLSERYRKFSHELPALCAPFHLDAHELPYNDYATMVSEWLKSQATL